MGYLSPSTDEDVDNNVGDHARILDNVAFFRLTDLVFIVCAFDTKVFIVRDSYVQSNVKELGGWLPHKHTSANKIVS